MSSWILKAWDFCGLVHEAKAGAFACMETGQRLEPSLAWRRGKGWSLRLLDAMSEGRAQGRGERRNQGSLVREFWKIYGKRSSAECLSLKGSIIQTTKLKKLMKNLILSVVLLGIALSGFAPQADAYCYYHYRYRYYYRYNPVTGRYYYWYRWWYSY